MIVIAQIASSWTHFYRDKSMFFLFCFCSFLVFCFCAFASTKKMAIFELCYSKWAIWPREIFLTQEARSIAFVTTSPFVYHDRWKMGLLACKRAREARQSSRM